MKQTVEQFESSIISFACKFAVVITLAAAMFMAGTLAHAQQPSREQCPNGSHYVQPPCYWDENGNRYCPAGYWVCN
jgi:hypothetical protein